MYLARPAAHQLELIAVVALEFARQLGGDLSVGAQYGLHSCSLMNSFTSLDDRE
ncbi:hypothetical protein D3C77_708720 [compost metagenome]